MRLSIILTALSFALYANASALNKRDVTTSAQNFIIQLETTASQGETADSALSSFTASQGYIGALAIQSQLSFLVSDAEESYSLCSSLTSPISDDDGDAIDMELDVFVTVMDNVISLLKSKKPIFDSTGIVTSLIKTNVLTFCTDLTRLLTCYVGIVPDDLSATAQSFASIISNACYTVVPLYS